MSYSSGLSRRVLEGPPVRTAAPRVPRVAAPRLPTASAPAVYDPFAPLTPGQINTQASTAVNSQIQPLIQQLQGLFAQRNAQGSQAITDYTAKLAQIVAPLAAQTGQIYADAQSKQQALDSTLKSNLTSGGQADANALTAQLSAAGQNTAPVAQVASAGASAGATRYALGSASLAQLIAQGANAQSYMAKQPGIEAATGQMNMRNFQAQLNQDLGTQVSDLQSKVPGLIQGELTSLQNQEMQKALARSSGLAAQTTAQAKASSEAFNEWYKKASLKEKAAYQSQILQLKQQGLTDAEAKVRAQQQRTQAAAQSKAQAKAQSAWNASRKGAYSTAATMYGSGGGQSANGLPAAPGTKQSVPYQQAYTRLFNVYGRPLVNYGYTQKAVDAMVRTALHTAGYGWGP